jgi:hypothetical protein
MIKVFQGLKEKRKNKAVQKNSEKLASKNSTYEGRLGAMDFLQGVGTEEAIYGLLRRFEYTYDHSIKDKDEKERVREIVAGFGADAVKPLVKFISTRTNIGTPIDILKQVVSEDEFVSYMCDAMGQGEILFDKNESERRLEILEHLKHYQSQRIVDQILTFFDSSDEPTRIAALEALRAQPTEKLRDPLLRAMIETGPESPRLVFSIAEVFAETDWTFKEERREIGALLPPEFNINKAGRIFRRK